MMRKLYESLKNSLRLYLATAVWLLIVGVAVRIFEALFLILTTGQPTGEILLLNLEGIGFDIIAFCRFSLFFFPIVFPIYHFFPKATSLFLRIFFTIFLAISTAMVIYYTMAWIPLDKIFFVYSWNEICHTVASSTNPNSWCYIFVLLFPALFFFLSSQKIVFHKFHYSMALIIFTASMFFIWKVENLYHSKKEYYTAVNKMNYFYKSVASGIYVKKLTPEQLTEKSEQLRQTFPQFTFTNPQFPFQHTDRTEDVLSDYFTFSEKKPNLVFVIVEGLSREFSGYETHYPSATPFLDSLAAEGLSWSNCFSSSYRTIGVLPSLFASLPHGNSGFMSYKYDMPDFQSLMTILNKNGYQSTFYYGGWTCFDDMCYFLQKNRVKIAFDEKDYPDSLKNEWGLYDHILFDKALQNIDFEEAKAPRIEIFLTLSTHQPFDFPNAAEYTEQYRQKVKTANQNYENEDVPYLQLSSFQYLDDALRNFISIYSQKKDFENTIFIFTGDHNFNMQTNSLEIAHVPLIIWSPMLKTSRQFPAMATHRDVTPSLLAMMKNVFHIEAPTEVTWLSEGLDTNSTFRSRIFCPQIDQGRQHIAIFFNDHVLYQNQLYRIENKDNRLFFKDSEQNTEISDALKNYLDLELYLMNNNLLLEDKKSPFLSK